MKKLVFALLVVFAGLTSLTNTVSAECVGQYGQYGQPCPSYAIVVDKMVGKPGTSNDSNAYSYVDNLGVSDARFKPGQVVFFKIKVKNTSTTKLVGMEVRDTVPSYLEPLDGPGSFNSTTREIVWNAGDFDVDQEKTYFLKMRVYSQANIPSDKGLFCVTNFVKANSANAYDDDTAQLCIEKQVTAKVVPQAGPEYGLILLGGQLALFGTGLYLKKRS
jgi:uncharacterized repeat protein (TIGR01451 family)